MSLSVLIEWQGSATAARGALILMWLIIAASLACIGRVSVVLSHIHTCCHMSADTEAECQCQLTCAQACMDRFAKRLNTSKPGLDPKNTGALILKPAQTESTDWQIA